VTRSDVPGATERRFAATSCLGALSQSHAPPASSERVLKRCSIPLERRRDGRSGASSPKRGWDNESRVEQPIMACHMSRAPISTVDTQFECLVNGSVLLEG